MLPLHWGDSLPASSSHQQQIEALKPQCALTAEATQRLTELEAEKEEVG
jgi:hypothetical protein